MVKLAVIAFATVVACAAPAAAQDNLPCGSFVRHASGVWSATKPATVTRVNGTSFNIAAGRSFGSGASFAGMPLALMLESQCRGISAEVP